MVFEREAQFELSGADGAGVGAVVDVGVPVTDDVSLQSLLVRGEPAVSVGGAGDVLVSPRATNHNLTPSLYIDSELST